VRARVVRLGSVAGGAVTAAKVGSAACRKWHLFVAAATGFVVVVGHHATAAGVLALRRHGAVAADLGVRIVVGGGISY